VLDSVAGCSAPVGDAQLAKDFSEMRVHGATAENQLARYLSIGPSAGQQSQHLGLARGQVMNAHCIDMHQPGSWRAAVQFCSPCPTRVAPGDLISTCRAQRGTQCDSPASVGLPNSRA
jgi:hypothetical protein